MPALQQSAEVTLQRILDALSGAGVAVNAASITAIQEAVAGRGAFGLETLATKTVTFTGAAGNGATGTVALFTATDQPILTGLWVYCTESLVAGAGTIAVGVTGQPALFIPVVAAAGFDASEGYSANNGQTEPGFADNIVASGTLAGIPFFGSPVLLANIIATIAGAAVTDGTLVIVATWIPSQPTSNLVAA